MGKKDKTAHAGNNRAIVDCLTEAYFAELETVMNYLANSVNLDGVAAEEIKKALAADVTAEIGHAQLLAARIKVLGGRVPGSKKFQARQDELQPPKKSTDLVAVIKGVIAAENMAISTYNRLIKLCEGLDYVTQDLAITILGEEENHRREFQGFLAEYADHD